MSLVSGTSNGIDGVVAQQASVIQRNKPVFLQAANCAGLKVFGRFRPNDMAALSTEIPLSAIAVLKRMFRNNFGCDPFMPLTAVRQQRQELSFEYECSSFTDDTTIHFLRVTNVPDVIKRTVISLAARNELQHIHHATAGQLRLMLPVDKGGCSTKLVLQVLSTSNRHSIHTARLLAFFRGGPDSYNNIHTGVPVCD